MKLIILFQMEQKDNHIYYHKEASYIINIFQNEEKGDLRGNLYLGSVKTLRDGRFKYKLGIDCVLTIIDRNCYQSTLIEKNINQHYVTHHKWIDIEDIEEMSIYPYLHDAHKYMRDMLNQTNVLVHCRMGKSRSASLVIAFLMKEYQMSYTQAKKYTKNKRDIVKPNEGFVKDLLRFQKQLEQLQYVVPKIFYK